MGLVGEIVKAITISAEGMIGILKVIEIIGTWIVRGIPIKEPLMLWK